MTVGYSKLKTAITNINNYSGSINLCYIQHHQSYRGCFVNYESPTWKTPELLVFDHDSCWDTVSVTTNTGSIMVKQILLLTGAQRSLWLSTGLWSIHRMMDKLTFEGKVEMLILIGWQNSFERFHIICERMQLDGDFLRTHPSYEFEKIA